MHPLIKVARLLIAIVVGWPLAFVPALLAGIFGHDPVGVAHLGLPLLLYPVAIWTTYRLLGKIPPFKTKPGSAGADSN